MRILAGEGDPTPAPSLRSGEVGYLPQDPREGDLDVLAWDRVLSALRPDNPAGGSEKQQVLMAEVVDDDARDKAIRRYGHLEERFVALGGYAAESEAGWICASLGLLSGCSPATATLLRYNGAASSWRESCSPPVRAAPAPTRPCCSTSRPTTRRRLDRVAARLPEGLARRPGDHQPRWDLLADVVNRVWFLDAVRGEADNLQHGLAEVPRRAGHRRTTSPTGTGQRREEGVGVAGAGPPSWVPRPPKPLPHRTCCAGPSG